MINEEALKEVFAEIYMLLFEKSIINFYYQNDAKKELLDLKINLKKLMIDVFKENDSKKSLPEDPFKEDIHLDLFKFYRKVINITENCRSFFDLRGYDISKYIIEIQIHIKKAFEQTIIEITK